MGGYTLHPPNSYRFTDDVIGSVVYRAKRSCLQAVDSFDAKKSKRPAHDQLHGWNPTDLISSVEATQEISSEKRKHTQDISSKVCHNRSHPDVICQDTSPLPIANVIGSADITKLLLLGKKIKREQWRKNQQRYREKQEKYQSNLEKSAQLLREEIELLEQRRCSLSSNASITMNVWTAVVEYFRLFRFGVQSNALAAASASMATPSSDQADYVRSVMVQAWCLTQVEEKIT
ncbi:unnamed protein product [Phytophthora fragariaefolia]|uniref:Unnamed protein product n=1 Tax=Phytophthora fragariaefolia TaxID=1490495 RepID=A0A9W6XTL3_9STRA|nr:unnamed protein product [Phytophthora fragariaefolia]